MGHLLLAILIFYLVACLLAVILAPIILPIRFLCEWIGDNIEAWDKALQRAIVRGWKKLIK